MLLRCGFNFDVMRLEKDFDNLLLLSGDGDFEILLKYSRK
jgi:uncharacterized LabA/DUF88 family protein